MALPIKSQPTGERLLEIIDGHVFRANGYPNLVEEDFFAWVLSEATREDATSLVGTLLGRIKRYDLTKINEDLLKELYQNLVEPEERQESGEFYTPDWLADLVIKDSGYPDAVKACVAEQSPLPVLVDPACGSGTFIFRAIATARENGVSGDQLVAYCCSRLMGMDVHPLAVTISKINFVLGLALELAAYRDDVHTPIYIADALQDFYGAGGGNSIEISSAGPGAESDVPEPFSIPAALATNRELFDQVIDRMQRYAEHAGDVRKITDGYWKSLAKLGVDDAWRAELVANCRLLTAHVRNRTDSIWGYVLRNCSQPAFLRNTKADFVVGNPPWKALRTVSHKAYQESIKKQAIRHGLITKKEGKLFSSLELCTLFFAVCEREYLKPTGTISFVLNRSVLTGALQHTAFQAFGFSRLMDGQEVVTTPGNEPVFPMPFCVLTRCAGQGLNRDIPCTVLKGRVPRGNPSLDVVRPLLRFEQTQFTPPPPLGVHTYYSTRFKEGATLNPMACWYVSVSGTIPKKASAPITIETDASRSARGKKQWQNRRLCGAVEREFFYATMRGVNYVPFGVLAFDLIVSPLKPYEPANDVLTYGKAVKEGYSFLADWIKQVEELWAAEKSAGSPKTAVARLNHQNLLQCQIPAREYKVIFNKSGTHPSSVVLDAATVVGSVVGGVVVNGFIADSQTYTYSTASLEEAHYLCAIINAACVDKAVKPFQSSGQQKERDLHTKILRASPVPQFDGGDSRHTRLASLSVGCHAVVEKAKSEISRCGDKKRRTISREMLAEPLQQIDVLANEVIEEEKKSMLGESPLSDNARWF